MVLKSLGKLILFLFLSFSVPIYAQIDTTKSQEGEEDYSIYENVESEGKIRVYCNPKIFDLSPNRFISVGYDYIVKSNLESTQQGTYLNGDQFNNPRTTSFVNHGLRINANLPVISKAKILWQIGGAYNKINFNETQKDPNLASHDQDELMRSLNQSGLTNSNLNTTVFKPLNEKRFIIFQGMGELNGNFGFSKNSNSPNLNTIKTSMSALYGKRPHDRLQWAVGLTRTYRGGELNYFPVIMYNYTSVNRKWGTEILFPGRASYRRKFNSRSILLAGYELEGSSYRLYNTNFINKNIELRRSELRLRLDYQRQLKGFVWVSIQAGMRYNVNYNIDSLGNSNKDFFRGFVGTQKYVMLNNLSLAPYFNVSLNLVSP